MHPLLSEGALHVWRADLTTVDEQLSGLLDAGERGRAEHIAQERTRQLWVRSRAVLRKLLGRYLEADPGTLRFAAGEHGKPRVLHARAISFNLSHSGVLALYAFSKSGDVGVDVETRRRPLDELALAARAFDPLQTLHLEGLSASQRQREFLCMWTRHEAALKLHGSGFGDDAQHVRRETWIADLDVGPQAAGAVASRSQPRELLCWDLL